MKKLSTLFGAIVLGFVLASCTTNPKENILKDIDAFFDQEVATVNAIANPDDLVAYIDGYDQKIDEFSTKIDNTYPVTSENIFKGMTKEEDDAIMEHLNQRYDGLWDIINTKGGEMMEPYIAHFEEVVDGLVNDIINDVEPADDIVDQLLAAYDDIEKYAVLGTDEQAERFGEADGIVAMIFGLDEEE